MPIALGNVVQDLENLDILTPNRLMLGRNNDRCPIGAITVTSDAKNHSRKCSNFRNVI